MPGTSEEALAGRLLAAWTRWVSVSGLLRKAMPLAPREAAAPGAISYRACADCGAAR